MNLILLFEKDFTDNRKVRLAGRRLRHVSGVIHAKPGDALCVGIEGGLIGTGTVTRLDGDVLEMDVETAGKPPDPLPFTLVLALPRPKVLRRMLVSAGSMGIKRIFLVNSYRVEKSYWQSPFLDGERIREQLVLGLEQARDTILPQVFLRSRFKPFVEDELPGILKGSLSLAAHPAAGEECPRNPGRPITLAIGPEGGFIPYEIQKLVSAGFSPVRLGSRILPVETALPFLVSRLF